MRKLHRTQQGLLELLKDHQDDPLTVRELQEELDLSSPSVVQHHINQLEKKGYLRRNPGNPRDYQILAESPDRKITYLNLYGQAQCGPEGTILSGNPIDRVPISSKILGFPSSDAFLLKAKGDSMEPKIHENDLIIARKFSGVPDNGATIVGVNDGRVLIKKFSRQGRNVILSSLNQKYPPIIVDKNFKVEGIVKGVLSYFQEEK